MDIDIDSVDYSEEVHRKIDEAIVASCEMIGQAAVRFASDPAYCPVDTGRLKNSMTYATLHHGASKFYKDDHGKAYFVALSEQAEEGEIIFGTNVEYGVYQEAIHHMVRKAAGNHTSLYKEILKNRLASALQ